MHSLTDSQVAEYFQRSYTAVDGLWFMKLEEQYGFDTALKIDNEVWKVLPKIQARKLKSLLNPAPGIDGLYDCLTTKLTLEGYTYEAQKDSNGFSLSIQDCPWRKLLVKSGREHLAERVSRVICHIEHTVWAAEFGDVRFELVKLCSGTAGCVLRFDVRQ